MKTISLDTETTGIDFYHSSKPFLVTFCDEEFTNTHYEWEVEPTTREVQVIPQDVEDIIKRIEESDLVVFQNAKFDISALRTILPEDYQWPWDKVRDTLVAGHLLASNHPHDLTSMAIEYLGIDIGSYDKDNEKRVKWCRGRVVRKGSEIGDWRISKVGLPEMPSVKEKTWKSDLWLPRAFARWCAKNDPELMLGQDEELFLGGTATYANVDSSVTLSLHQAMEVLLQEKDLWEIYLERLKNVYPIHTMEQNGVTLSERRLDKLTEEYRLESEAAGKTCLNIAKLANYDLKLPKSGNNKSLTEFVFNELKLPTVSTSKKTGNPSLNKDVIAEYQATLRPNSKGLKFINNLGAKRKRDTAVGYMEGYQKFMLEIPNVVDYYVLHPSINQTGTDTLRCSSANPNEQNISKKKGFNLRYAFGPAPGREWWSLDYSNQEARIPAYESEEEELIALFENESEPPYYGKFHLLNFHTVYPDIWAKELKTHGLDRVGPVCKDKYASTWYQWVKNGDFAVQYGSVEESGTADKAFHRPGSFAKIKSRFKKIHGPGGLNEQQIAHAQEFGYVETLPDRTVNPRRGYPLFCSRSHWGRVKPTVPLNYHIQGSACWVTTRAMVKVQKYLDQLNRGLAQSIYRMIMQVHDEIVLDFPYRPNKGNLPKVQIIQKLMSSIGQDLIPSIPLPVGIDYHPRNWSASE